MEVEDPQKTMVEPAVEVRCPGWPSVFWQEPHLYMTRTCLTTGGADFKHMPQGTRNMLEAVRKATTVKRVVLTSSVASTQPHLFW